ncbi:unnamed protein product, partial [Prorocentrum cordatum]
EALLKALAEKATAEAAAHRATRQSVATVDRVRSRWQTPGPERGANGCPNRSGKHRADHEGLGHHSASIFTGNALRIARSKNCVDTSRGRTGRPLNCAAGASEAAAARPPRSGGAKRLQLHGMDTITCFYDEPQQAANLGWAGAETCHVASRPDATEPSRDCVARGCRRARGVGAAALLVETAAPAPGDPAIILVDELFDPGPAEIVDDDRRACKSLNVGQLGESVTAHDPIRPASERQNSLAEGASGIVLDGSGFISAVHAARGGAEWGPTTYCTLLEQLDGLNFKTGMEVDGGRPVVDRAEKLRAGVGIEIDAPE